jgi:pimeloyl-ACP methyl ester carboxylesterase
MRRGRTAAWVLAVVAVLVLVLLAAATWYFSGVLIDRMAIQDYSDDLPDTVVRADAQTITLDMAEDPADDARGVAVAGMRFAGSDTYLQVGPVTTTEGSTVTRPVTRAFAELPPAGASARVEYDYYPGDPQVGLGLDFTEVQIPTPLGPTPAWYVPADGATWAIFSHGRGATRGEGLRMLATSHALGMPTLLLTFRDDLVGQPEDGISNFGLTEWEDLEAGVQYALDNGAENVVLIAASTGGAISLAFLENSELADEVVGMAFDAPLTSFGQTVDLGAAEMGIPGPLVAAGKWLTERRVNIDFEQTDYVSRVDDLAVPTLIIHGTQDGTNPIEASEQFAATAPEGVVRLEEVEGAAHVWAWNTDRGRYEQVLSEHLSRLLAD